MHGDPCSPPPILFNRTDAWLPNEFLAVLHFYFRQYEKRPEMKGGAKRNESSIYP